MCGVPDLLVAGVEFEFPVRSATTGTIGFIDVLWRDVMLAEHKSAGQDLDRAEKQARDYLLSLDPAMRPPVIVVSDFQRFRVIEVLAGASAEFSLADLPEHLHRFGAIIGSRGAGAAHVEVAADAEAAELMSALFVAFEKAGYDGHAVSVFLVRVLFLLFGDDTQMWRRERDMGLFEALVASSSPDGTGLGGTLQELFQVLNSPRDKRPSSLPASLADFPYANGGLFAEPLQVFSFTSDMRAALLKACSYQWASISPAIFGTMFQSIRSREARRELGQHYTSEANILKTIGPLFLTEMNERLRKDWDRPARLRAYKRELGTYTWADPACGAGDFLIVTYLRMRDLELRITARLQELAGHTTDVSLSGDMELNLKLSQFHGIEYDEWSAQIASVAMVLAEHQANLAMERLLGSAPDLLPLSDAAHITYGNALRLDWSQLFPINERTYLMGNPPFYGTSLQTSEQKQDTAMVWGSVTGSGNLDYVANWYRVAARYICDTGARAAFVSSNSITQGEQPPVIWGQLYGLGIGIDFAHRTFAWTNEASGKAAVHVVIIGFSAAVKPAKRPVWSYETPKSEPVLSLVKNINAYLLDAPDVLVSSRRTPLSKVLPPMEKGNIPTDGGFLSNISAQEAEAIRKDDPKAAKYLRRLVGARELIHGDERWCLWLVDADPADIRTSSVLGKRIEGVRDLRAKSNKAKTREDAKRANEFQEIRQPKTEYLAIPRHSSEMRDYLPVARFGPEVITNDAVSVIADPSPLTFGLLSSRVFWIWAQAVSGRLESRIRVSNSVTYNNFPVPDLSDAARTRVTDAADSVLRSRGFFAWNTLADLYAPGAMPHQLLQAHNELDAAVTFAFGIRAKPSTEMVLERLFDLYGQMTAGLLPAPRSPRRRRSAA